MKTRKGFTLIELLIVIVVMGILSSMMIVSSSESTSTARANNIISNLRNFSMAAMALYTDSMDIFGKNPSYLSDKPDDFKKAVVKYMHNEGEIPDIERYTIINDKDSRVWWAGYKLDQLSDGNRIMEKLESRASNANLKGTTGSTPPNGEGTQYNSSTSKHKYVWLKIRSSKKN